MFFRSISTGHKVAHAKRGLCVLALSALLAGCAAIGGERETTSDTFELGLTDVADVSPVRRGTQILVPEPAALKALDSENIVVRTEPLVIQYLDDAQWSDRLPKIVQTRLSDAFIASDRFSGVGLPGQGLAIDYQIITEIRQFSIDARSSSAEVVINAKLLNDRNGNVIGTRQFSAVVPTASGSRAYVSALDAAFAEVASDIIRWVAARI